MNTGILKITTTGQLRECHTLLTGNKSNITIHFNKISISMPAACLEHPTLPLKMGLEAGHTNGLKAVHVCGTGHRSRE